MAQAGTQLEELFRHEAGKICAWLGRLLGPARLDLIEDAVQDAFSAALAQWSYQGMPERPSAWLAVAARNKAFDRLRRDSRLDPVDLADEAAAWRLGFSNPEDTGRIDDTLALMFVACHPALSLDEQTMLTLQTVCGFNPRQIGRAYLSSAEAVTQRLVRAKRRIKDLRLTFEIPEGRELAQRLPGLHSALYQLFTGGYTAVEGEALLREEFCAEALRLTTLLSEHGSTATGETHSLAALMCFHHARAATRTGEAGDLVLLAEQDRSRWSRPLLTRGFDHLRSAMSSAELTALHVEAGIAALHVSAASFAETDWSALSQQYEILLELKPTAVVRLNAAIARAYAEGAASGLQQLDELSGHERLANYAPYHAARADLLSKLARCAEATDAFAQALKCQVNGVERDYLMRRLKECEGRLGPGDRTRLN